MTENLFEVRNLRKSYPVREEGILSALFGERRFLKAVDRVNFDIKRGEIIGLSGQSGCGKSTLGELLLGLDRPTGGTIEFEGEDMTTYGKAEMKEFRRRCQVIFQDPYESLNPRFPVSRFVSEPLTIHGIGDREERDARTMRALEEAGLSPAEKYLSELPSELSGGERQRVSIARALVVDPEFIVADEPLSMLDVSVRAGILHLFQELQEIRDFTMLYISHNLLTIDYLTDRTMIMYLGDIVEMGRTEDVIHDPAHPYTETLINALPTPDPDTSRTSAGRSGDIPDPVDLPSGCRYTPYCKYATNKCHEIDPELESVDTDHFAACIHPIGVED